MKRGIYAFSADPITKGHIDIIKRASRFFDELIVAIGVNQEKNYTFELKDRIKMVKDSLIGLKNIKIVTLKGLLVDYAYENNIPVIVKGVRNSEDFSYERNLHVSGESQKLGIETFIMFADPTLSHVSSSGIKQMQNEQALLYDLVTVNVKEKLEKELSGQFILGVTGEIGTGKSYVCNELVKMSKKIQVHNIELDEIGHKIYKDLKEPVYRNIRKKIIDEFGISVKNKDGTINRKNLGDIVFNNNEKLKKLNEIMYKPLIVRFRREIYGKKGIILFNAALLSEADMTNICNNNVLLVKSNDESQIKRLKERELSSEQIKRRLKSQYTEEEKRKNILKKIKEDNHGTLIEYDNSDGKNDITKLYEKIKKLYES